MKREVEKLHDANAVFDMLKKLAGIESDAALARELGLHQPNLVRHRRMNTLPYAKIIKFANRENIPLNLIF